jgi:hypothetical protein
MCLQNMMLPTSHGLLFLLPSYRTPRSPHLLRGALAGLESSILDGIKSTPPKPSVGGVGRAAGVTRRRDARAFDEPSRLRRPPPTDASASSEDSAQPSLVSLSSLWSSSISAAERFTPDTVDLLLERPAGWGAVAVASASSVSACSVPITAYCTGEERRHRVKNANQCGKGLTTPGWTDNALQAFYDSRPWVKKPFTLS